MAADAERRRHNLSAVTFLIPVSALLPGLFILGEDPAWSAYADMALIFADLAAIDGRLWRRLRPGEKARIALAD